MAESEKQAFSARLHEALDALGIPERGRMRRLAEMTGVSINAAKKWLIGESIPQRERWKEIAAAVGADWQWLFLGEPSPFSEAIGKVIRRWRKEQDPAISLPQLAKFTGIPMLRIAFLEEGKGVPSHEESLLIKMATGINPIEEAPSLLADVKGLHRRIEMEVSLKRTTQIDGIIVPVYSDVEAAAGDGMLAPDVEVPSEFVWIAHSRLVPFGDPSRLVIIRAKGDSMADTFHDGDLLLCSVLDGEDVRDGIHVFRIGDEIFVKRLQRLPGGQCLAISDNKVYHPFEVDLSREDVRIIARVVLAWTAKAL